MYTQLEKLHIDFITTKATIKICLLEYKGSEKQSMKS